MLGATQVFVTMAMILFQPACAGFSPHPLHQVAIGDASDLEEMEDFVLMSTNPMEPQVALAAASIPAAVDIRLAEFAPAASSQVPWEAKFSSALRESDVAMAAATDADAGTWTSDSVSSGGVPARMLAAEEAMAQALEAVPQGKVHREKSAMLALRIYNHAKWLAERNHAAPAEERYMKAKDLALRAKRSVLAGHALSRLGYFLMRWGRFAEAREVLKESHAISKKSNPLAPYLLGVLERKAAGADLERLRAADALVLSAEEQPSEELEQERRRLVEEIRFWREAEANPTKCADGATVAHVLICFAMNAALAVRGILV